MKSQSILAPARAQHHLSREEDGDGREQKSVWMQNSGHVSVMPRETLEQLAVTRGDVVLDATAGMGGHSELMLEAGAGRVISLDADPKAVEAARKRLARFGERSVVLESNFKDTAKALE